MSNFTGVTFAQQKVLPSDDAIIRRVILPDGILYGCELSYSGSTLTMAAGQMLICGRQIRHPSSQNWAVVDATSGFARLLLTVDLTRTSTKEVFEQVVDIIEYAAAEDGFPELEQSDVNVSGSRYQVVACVVSLGTGGITGIVTQLQPSRVEGGGGLNFSVVGGLTQPANPKENTIWVNTDTDITSWIFSATEPTGAAGMVWFTVGASSGVEFNALKKNSIQVYPLSAKQYVDGVWAMVTAKSYQDGAWVDWVLYLYDYGEQAFTWSARKWKRHDGCTTLAPTVTEQSDGSVKLTFTVSSGTTSGVYEIGTDIDFTNLSTLEITYKASTTQGVGFQYQKPNIVITPRGATYWADEAAATKAIYSTTETTETLDVSGVSGSYDVCIGFYINAGISNNSGTQTLTLGRIIAKP